MNSTPRISAPTKFEFSVLPEGTSYQCFPAAPEKVRRPDTSFIRLGRLPGEELPEGHLRIAPDLAVEVVSPNDKEENLTIKVANYLANHPGDYEGQCIEVTPEKPPKPKPTPKS